MFDPCEPPMSSLAPVQEPAAVISDPLPFQRHIRVFLLQADQPLAHNVWALAAAKAPPPPTHTHVRPAPRHAILLSSDANQVRGAAVPPWEPVLFDPGGPALPAPLALRNSPRNVTLSWRRTSAAPPPPPPPYTHALAIACQSRSCTTHGYCTHAHTVPSPRLTGVGHPDPPASGVTHTTP